LGLDERMTEVQTHVFRASLSPKIYRDFEILSAKNLYDLAAAIVRIFGFDFDHAFGFYSKLTGRVFGSPVKYELFADMGESEARSVKRTRIVDAFPTIGAKMTFLFDYGDNWQFRVEAIGQNRKERGVRYPRLLKTVGEAPEQYPDPDDE
jgi:pRiA4b ORF-3-like protein